MKELLKHITERIVNNPEDIEIQEVQTEGGAINLSLKVHPEDMGLIIGKNGSTIRAIRNLLKVKAIKDDVRFNLELVETGHEQKSNEF